MSLEEDAAGRPRRCGVGDRPGGASLQAVDVQPAAEEPVAPQERLQGCGKVGGVGPPSIRRGGQPGHQALDRQHVPGRPGAGGHVERDEWVGQLGAPRCQRGVHSARVGLQAVPGGVRQGLVGLLRAARHPELPGVTVDGQDARTEPFGQQPEGGPAAEFSAPGTLGAVDKPDGRGGILGV